MQRVDPKTRRCQRCGQRFKAARLCEMPTALGFKWLCFDCRQPNLPIFARSKAAPAPPH